MPCEICGDEFNGLEMVESGKIICRVCHKTIHVELDRMKQIEERRKYIDHKMKVLHDEIRFLDHEDLELFEENKIHRNNLYKLDCDIGEVLLGKIFG